MCGIIGYKSNTDKDVNNIIVNGLKRLEYRGYDSFGLAWVDNNLTDSIQVIKKPGRISGFNLNSEPKSSMGLGHTRWATHGKVDELNAHPHFSNNKNICVVHNGIIENFQELKELLKSEGFKFYSETDTEVIPNLIEYFMKEGNNFFDACKRTFNKIEGSFAVVVLYKNPITNKQLMVGVKNGSPLVVGIKTDRSKGEKTFYLASDIPAFLEHTNQVSLLNDGEMVFLNDNIEFYNYKTGDRVIKKTEEIKWKIEQAEKGKYKHFMMKEISEQGSTIKRAIKQDKELIEKVGDEIKKADNVLFIGAGTSYHACVSASYIFSEIASKRVYPVLASEFSLYERFISDKTLVIAVSQSGETADLLEAVKKAKERKAKVVSITNVFGSTLMRLSDHSILMNAGPEICVLSTKSYTAQIAIIILLAYALIKKAREAKKIIEKVSFEVDKLIGENKEKLKGLGEKIIKGKKKDIFLIGRDYDYPTALEGALKIKEVSYLHAEGFAGGELKHGTIALIEKDVPVIALVSKKTEKQILSNAMEVKARGGFIIGISSKDNPIFDYFIRVPEFGVCNNILMIIPIQILAYYLAILRGLDPDKPRNLAKSVTVK